MNASSSCQRWRSIRPSLALATRRSASSSAQLPGLLPAGVASRKYWDQISHDLRPVYTAPNRQAAETELDLFLDKWGRPYPAIVGLWRNAWEEFTPLLADDTEIRRVLRSTNAIESLNARYRRAVRARGHFPTAQAAMKTLYLVTRSLDPKGTGQTRWVTRSKPALNAFAITFADRMPAVANRLR